MGPCGHVARLYKVWISLTIIACGCLACCRACALENSNKKILTSALRWSPMSANWHKVLKSFRYRDILQITSAPPLQNLSEALKSNWSLLRAKEKGKSSTKDQPLWLSNWKKDIAETSSQERCICESVCWLRRREIEDEADTNKYPVRVFGGRTATMTLKTLSERRHAKDIRARTDARTAGNGNAADRHRGEEEGFPCFLAEEQSVSECKKTQD